MSKADISIAEVCDDCGRTIDVHKELIFFCEDYKARCFECYKKWGGRTAS